MSCYILPFCMELLIQKKFFRIRSRQLRCLLWASADGLAIVAGTAQTTADDGARSPSVAGAASERDSGFPGQDSDSPATDFYHPISRRTRIRANSAGEGRLVAGA